jgi:hypothetical protein
MKIPTSSPSPRLVCQVVRATRVFFENAGGDHIDVCADCQAFFRPADHLDLELRREAAVQRRAASEPSTELERSIMRAVRDERDAARPAAARRSSPAPWWAMGVVAAAAVAVMVYFQRPATSSPDHAATPDDAVAVVDAVENFSAKITDTVIPATGALVANNPLQRELGSVYSDARSALNFLALNFLPNATGAAAGKPASAI